MAEEFQSGICGGNWWNLPRSVFIGGSSPCSNQGIINNNTTTSDMMLGSYGSWDVVDLKPIRSCNKDSRNTAPTNDNSVSADSPIVFQDSHNKPHQQTDSDSGGSSILMDSTLQMMGFGISSSSPQSSSDWRQTLLRSNSRCENYNSMLQDEMNSSSGLNSSHHQIEIQKDWSPKSFTNSTAGHDSATNAFKAVNHQEFYLEQQRLNATATTCQSLSSDFSMGPTVSYGYPSTLVQSLFGCDDTRPQLSLLSNRTTATINYSTSSPPNYGTILNELSPSWPKLAPFLNSLLPKQQPSVVHGLHFSNNTPFWNASATPINDIRASCLPSSQPQFLLPSFEEKPNCPNITRKPNNGQVRDSGSVVKKGSEPALKRPRIETPSPLPTFKVRKEKLGDRITALQQLVSPFGKTDTASVLHEAIEYIKFLHDQVNVLSTPYMKNGNPIQHEQVADKLKDPEGSKKDLKSRGLCLVPISSTFPVANETTADFWTPTFGGTFR